MTVYKAAGKHHSRALPQLVLPIAELAKLCLRRKQLTNVCRIQASLCLRRPVIEQINIKFGYSCVCHQGSLLKFPQQHCYCSDENLWFRPQPGPHSTETGSHVALGMSAPYVQNCYASQSKCLTAQQYKHHYIARHVCEARVERGQDIFHTDFDLIRCCKFILIGTMKHYPAVQSDNVKM